MIRLHHVSKSYPNGCDALTDVSLHIPKGQLAFLTGASGAGKTTLLRLILREELPTKGNITVNGRNVAAMPLRDVPFLRRTIGIVFQDFKLIQNRTVLENLTFVQEAVGVSRIAHVPRAMRVLKQVSLQHKINAYPVQLSGGEQQRASIARALVNDPVLLLADEPTGNLDPDLAEEIMNLLKSINAHGTTVLIATHDRELIHRFARRVVHLEDGVITDVTGAGAASAAAGAGGIGEEG